MKLLVSSGARLNMCSPDNGNTALHFAVSHTRGTLITLLKQNKKKQYKKVVLVFILKRVTFLISKWF